MCPRDYNWQIPLVLPSSTADLCPLNDVPSICHTFQISLQGWILTYKVIPPQLYYPASLTKSFRKTPPPAHSLTSPNHLTPQLPPDSSRARTRREAASCTPRNGAMASSTAPGPTDPKEVPPIFIFNRYRESTPAARRPSPRAAHPATSRSGSTGRRGPRGRRSRPRPGPRLRAAAEGPGRSHLRGSHHLRAGRGLRVPPRAAMFSEATILGRGRAAKGRRGGAARGPPATTARSPSPVSPPPTPPPRAGADPRLPPRPPAPPQRAERPRNPPAPAAPLTMAGAGSARSSRRATSLRGTSNAAALPGPTLYREGGGAAGAPRLAHWLCLARRRNLLAALLDASASRSSALPIGAGRQPRGMRPAVLHWIEDMNFTFPR